jgi:hypothetical protein
MFQQKRLKIFFPINTAGFGQFEKSMYQRLQIENSQGFKHFPLGIHLHPRFFKKEKRSF